jgi:hypothetical protein
MNSKQTSKYEYKKNQKTQLTAILR